MMIPYGVRYGNIQSSGKLSSTKKSLVGFLSKIILVSNPLIAITATWPETETRLSTTRTSSPGFICFGSFGNCMSCCNLLCASWMYSPNARCESSVDGVMISFDRYAPTSYGLFTMSGGGGGGFSFG